MLCGLFVLCFFREAFDCFDERFGRVGKHLACRCNQHFVCRISTALRLNIEKGERVDLVAPKFDAHRGRAAGRKDVRNAAADGKLRRSFNLRPVFVARAD